ncbi:MAG: Mov34/MPN/PAD-1 family protein [Tepidisphaeraceae bacterium]
MGVMQTVETENDLSGGVDFSRLPRRELIKLSGLRTTSFQVVVRQSALNHVHLHGDSSPRAEVCGVLVGDVYHDDTGDFLLVEHVIEGQAAAGSAGQVTFTADTWQHIQVLMDKQYPDLRIVGWYHTHPGHGVFLSDMDIFLHESFFGLPWQAALVYDPRSGEEGVFKAHKSRSQRLDYIVEADEPATAAPPSPVLSPEAAASLAPDSTSPRTPAMYTRKPRRSIPIGRYALGVIGLVLFIMMGGLLGLLIRVQHLQLPYWIQNMAHK